MKKLLYVLSAGVLLAGCSDESPTNINPEAPRQNVQYWGSDADSDGIDDGTEWDLANRFAPVLSMPNLIERSSSTPGDWAWPATMDYYLPRVRMRMHHDNCPDHTVLNTGYVSSYSITRQSHQRAASYLGCTHSGATYYSNRDWAAENHFFLQPTDDGVHQGVRSPDQWKVYFHAYKNNIGGINIQYWFFYAYNDFAGGFNHEADWEHINVKLRSDYTPEGVYFSAHHDVAWHPWYNVTRLDETHPRVWVADGSHASYNSFYNCNTTYVYGWPESCWDLDTQRWYTWSGGRGYNIGYQGAGLVNIGEKATPMSGQEWIQYSGRWGELGSGLTFGGTDGPRGPAYQGNWTRDAYVAPSGGGGYTNECTEEGGQTTSRELMPSCPL
jgi:hypothetical protein